MSFGSNLIALRQAHGLSRKELAAQLAIPYTTLRNYETDQREPGHQLLIQLATMFSVSVDELIGRPGGAAISAGAMKLAKDFDALDAWGQRLIRDVMADELARVNGANPHRGG